MQKIVVVKPYRFVPARRSSFWPRLLRPLLPFHLRTFYGVTSVTCRGTERLRASIDAGHGIILAANHCRLSDPLVVGVLAAEVRQYLYIMSSWHVFMQNPLYAWILPRGGVFSVHREGTDRASIRYAIGLVAEAERPLLIFPEGVNSRHNDRLNNLMEGTAIIGRGAARQRASLSPPGSVVIHPLAIRYLFGGDLEATVSPVLESLEARMAWRPQKDLPLLKRVLKVGSAMLALKEIEYLGEPNCSGINERVERLIDHLLMPIEDEWLKQRQAGDVVRRVKLLRKAVLAGMTSGELPQEEQDRRNRQLADLYLAQQLSCYPAGYFTPEPTPERILETVERFEEDTTDIARVHSALHAIVDVGQAIKVPPEERQDDDSDPLLGELQDQLTNLLAASLAEFRPGAAMR